MKKTAEVIMIGAGIIGTSIAYHLAKLGCRDVVILEKEADIGVGATAKAAGGVRQEFNQETNIKLSLESLEFFKRFQEETGYPSDLYQCGYLRFVSTEEELEELSSQVALQRQFGVEVSLISPDEAKKIVPALDITDILGATYCPTDGKVDPYSVVQGYAYAARNLGVEIFREVEVIGVRVANGGQVRGVLTSEGEVEAPVVVNAAGPYAGLLGKTVGLEIPVHPNKKQNFFTARTDEIRKDAPFIMDLHQGYGVWREGLGLTLSGTDYDQPEGFDTTVDWSFLPKLAERVVSRFPFMIDVGIRRAEAGLHPDTPDQSPILGSVPELKGFYMACGLNSQGIMHSPAVGRLMAEYILGISCDPAISRLSLSRFQNGALQREGMRSARN